MRLFQILSRDVSGTVFFFKALTISIIEPYMTKSQGVRVIRAFVRKKLPAIDSFVCFPICRSQLEKGPQISSLSTWVSCQCLPSLPLASHCSLLPDSYASSPPPLSLPSSSSFTPLTPRQEVVEKGPMSGPGLAGELSACNDM